MQPKIPEDRYGLALTTNPDAATHYRQGVDRLLAANAGAGEYLERAVQADERFALAHIALAMLYDMEGKTGQRETALRAAILHAPPATPRERRHVRILEMLLRNEPVAAYRLLQAHVRAHPLDAFILSQVTGAYGILAFSGKSDFDRERLSMLESVRAGYGNDWWFLGMHAYSLAEVSRHGEAREQAEQSLALFYHNGHAAHSYAHVLYESDRPDEASAFLAGWLPGYDTRAPIAGHLCWHQALCEAQRGNHAQALDIYQARLRPAVTTSPGYGKLIDAASALWRLELMGVPVCGIHWQELADEMPRHLPPTPDPFLDIHMALIYAAHRPGNDAWVGALLEKYHVVAHPLAGLVEQVSRGLCAFAGQDYAKAGGLLAAATPGLPRIGGSHAQRGLVSETMRCAAGKCGA